jgi:GNAT superfamily N-acetyltransferase
MSDAQIHAFLRASSTEHPYERVGPFTLRLSPGSTHPMVNYAVPDDGVRPGATEVAALVEAFEQRCLVPRLEYAERAAPGLELTMGHAGFTREARLPLMTCRPGDERLAPAPPDFDIVRCETAADHRDALLVADRAYGEPPLAPTDEQVERRRALDARGQAVVLARYSPTRAPAGSGLVTTPRAGVSELAAIGTAPEFRRQRVAAGITARLVQLAFGGGVHLLWLTPEHEAGERIYRRVGFARSGGYMVHLARGPVVAGSDSTGAEISG